MALSTVQLAGRRPGGPAPGGRGDSVGHLLHLSQRNFSERCIGKRWGGRRATGVGIGEGVLDVFIDQVGIEGDRRG